MKNKNGFTVVELIASFSLAMVIAVFLFDIIINLKNLYTNSVTKTELVNIQSLVSRQINDRLKNNEIKSILKCGTYCLNFKYVNGESDKLVLDYDNKTIQFGSYKSELPDDSYFGTATVDSSYSGTLLKTSNNAMILINIPMYNNNLPNQSFNINVVYQYNTNVNDIYLSDFSKDDNEFGYLQLKGETDATLVNKDDYVERGYIVVNADGNEITGGVVTINNPLTNLSKPYPVGEYKIEYMLSYVGVDCR